MSLHLRDKRRSQGLCATCGHPSSTYRCAKCRTELREQPRALVVVSNVTTAERMAALHPLVRDAVLAAIRVDESRVERDQATVSEHRAAWIKSHRESEKVRNRKARRKSKRLTKIAGMKKWQGEYKI